MRINQGKRSKAMNMNNSKAVNQILPAARVFPITPRKSGINNALTKVIARDYYDSTNPLIRILLPKMNYAPEERESVIVHAYAGLYQLASRMLFDKYVDFIDIYAEVRAEEREQLYENLEQRKEMVMLAQYIRNKGFQDGIEKGVQKGEISILQLQLNQRFGQLPEWLQKKVEEANKKDLELWARRILSAKTLQEIFE